MMKRSAIAALLTVAAMTGWSVLAAPPKTEEGVKKPQAGESAARSADQQTAWKSNDHLLAACVAIENQEEVAIANYAQDKIKHDEVKKFAKMLVADHTAFLEKLRKYAPEASDDSYLNEERTNARTESAPPRKPLAAAERDEKARPNATQRTAAKPPLDNPSAAPIDLLALHRELAQQCLADSKAMMSEKNGEEFDQCFVGMQIAKHAGMKTKLTVFERHASGELAQLFAEAGKKTQSHMDQAIKLMEKLADQERTTAAKSEK